MKLKAVTSAVLALGVAAVLTACGGGGGSTSTGGTYYSHAQLADEFVKRAYGDASIDAKLIKTNTEQYNYIVVYDYDLDTYDAYWLGGYNVGENIYDYITRNNSKMYYDLDYLGANRYQDYWTGVTFEETKASSKDLEKVAALKQEVRIQKSAEKLKADFGLSASRARQVARLAIQVADAPKRSMTDRDYDNFSKDLLGSSITSFKSAMKKSAEGDKREMNALIGKAAKVNGVGPEHANQLLNSMFQN